jgi:hypothetical protein
MHDRKKTAMSIISTQRNNTNHGIESKSFFYSFNLYMGVLHKFPALLFLLSMIMLQCTKEGVYIHFPSSKTETIKSTINSYLTTLNLLNAFLSTKDESLKAQGPLYNTSVLLYEQLHKRVAQQLPKHFKICIGVIQLSFLLHALAHLMSERCPCIKQHVVHRFFG